MPALDHFTRINQPRVAKIEATIATIRKSARSNRISPEDVAALLAPIALLLVPAVTIATRSLTDEERQKIIGAKLR